jgi:hypothetical protein
MEVEAAEAGIAYGDGAEAPAAGRHGGRISREGQLLAGGAIILAASFLYTYMDGILGAITPGCLFKRVTGLPCLLCGMTRSMAATAHGHLAEAFRFHLLGPPLFVLVTGVTLLLVAEFAFSRRLLPRPGERVWRYMAWGTLGLLVAAWIARLAIFGINV